MAYHNQQGVNTAIARIFNTYGPRMRRNDGRATVTFLHQALEGKPLTVFGDGSQTRSLCYVDDLIRGPVPARHLRRALAGQHRQPGPRADDARSSPRRASASPAPRARSSSRRCRSTTRRSAGPTSPGPGSCSAGSPRSISTRACAAGSGRSATSRARTAPEAAAPRRRAARGRARRRRRSAARRGSGGRPARGRPGPSPGAELRVARKLLERRGDRVDRRRPARATRRCRRSTTSGRRRRRVATTGVPAASASIATTGVPSLPDGSSSASKRP